VPGIRWLPAADLQLCDYARPETARKLKRSLRLRVFLLAECTAFVLINPCSKKIFKYSPA
jgi:hypothetical protein